MSKYTEIAERMKSIRASHNDRLDALAERMTKHEVNSDDVFRRYEGTLEEQELGMGEMERDMRDMSNFKKEDDKTKTEGGETGSESTVAKFPGTGEQAKAS